VSPSAKLAQLRSILPCDRWSELATRPRSWPNLDEPAPWTAVRGAPLSLDEAIKYRNDGILLTALRYSEHETTVVAIPRKEAEAAQAPPKSAADPITNWPDDRLARLVELWREVDDEGPLHSIGEIGEILGCPAEAVRTKAKSLGWSTRARQRMAA
jgi:hypothetical protein